MVFTVAMARECGTGSLYVLYHRGGCVRLHCMYSCDRSRLIVESAIDFGLMRSRVLLGSYKTPEAFASDFHLLCKNAIAFNERSSIYHREVQVYASHV